MKCKSNLNVDKKTWDEPVEGDLGDPTKFRILSFLVFCVTLFLGTCSYHMSARNVLVLKEGSTQEDYNNYYKEMYKMYADGNEFSPDRLAHREATKAHRMRKYIPPKPESVYKNPFIVGLFSISVILFLLSFIYEWADKTIPLLDLKCKRDEEERLETEEVEKILSDPTFDPLNKKYNLCLMSLTSKKK